MAAASETSPRGVMAWMLGNPVAANLLMIFFLAGGLISLPAVQREVFPDAKLDMVSVVVPYPGATPEDVEEGVLLPLEAAVRGVDGVDTVRGAADSSQGRIIAELSEGADANAVLNDIESEVNRITAFPPQTEEPVITIPSKQVQVLTLFLYGRLERQVLDRLARGIRTDLMGMPAVSRVVVQGVSSPEISIDVSQETLRRYGLTRETVARRVKAETIEISGGTVRSDAGFVRLRTLEDREWAEAFNDIVLISSPDGAAVTLGEVAEIRETFRKKDVEATVDGLPAIGLQVFRAGSSSPTEVAGRIREYIEKNGPGWGDAVNHIVWNDASRIYQDRVGLLVRNGLQGLFLVLVILSLFLRPHLAFWVTLGLPISFLGAFLFLPALGVSINMLSLFAFILVLGIVVDDAIVVGEASFERAREGADPVAAALEGVREVRIPVVFAVTTTLMVFVPMLFIPGVIGEFFAVIPLSVIPILLISLVESMLILPVHIGHLKKIGDLSGWLGIVTRKQQVFSDWFETKSQALYGPLVRFVIQWRYLVLALSLVFLAAGGGLVYGRHIGFFFMPKIEGKIVRILITLPSGTSFDTTQQTVKQIEAAGRRILEDTPGVLRGIYAVAGSHGTGRWDVMSASSASFRPNIALIEAGFVPPDQRDMSTVRFARQWREAIQKLPGIDQVTVSYSIGPQSGKTLAFELRHPRYPILRKAAEELARELEKTEGVIEVDKGYDTGAPEIRLALTPEGRALGLDATRLSAQVRAHFYGIESFVRSRGRDELRIYIRATERERRTMAGLEQMLVFTPAGEIPLDQAARQTWSRAPTRIDRKDGRRIITVTGDVDARITTANTVSAHTRSVLIPALQNKYPGLTYTVGGEQENQKESLRSIFTGLAVAFLVMYGLLATVFKSYFQPVLIFAAIPFGWAGAVFGHLALGYDLTVISILGMLALSGVVINDALVLVYAINERRQGGMGLDEAVEKGGLRRLRPVLLTSLTTFFGLTPMITETSIQARFLIPMAISLGIGVLFVTIIILVILPAAYRILHDILPKDGQYRGVDEKL